MTTKRTTPPPRLLVVDDDPRYGQWLSLHLGVFCPESTVNLLDSAGFERWCEGGAGRDCDILLLSAGFGSSPEDPKSTGLTLLRRLRGREVFPAVIVLAEEGNELTAVRALQLGAVDYLPKRLLTPERLNTAIRLAVRRLEKRVLRKLATLAHVANAEQPVLTSAAAAETWASMTVAPVTTQKPKEAVTEAAATAAATQLMSPRALVAALEAASAAAASKTAVASAVPAEIASATSAEARVATAAPSGIVSVADPVQERAPKPNDADIPVVRAAAPASTALPAVTAEFIPGYVIKMKIGESEKAVVYLATSIALGSNVALKVSKTLRDEAAGRQFLEREYTAIIAIRDPLVVQIYDYGVHGGYEYLAMEYLLHGDLKARMQSGLKEKEALRYVEQIAAALRVVHKAGLLHRDLKPPNVMLRDNDEVALIDFGLARALDGSTPSTRTGVLRGSPYYMSPEQALGEELDARSDFYSLGIIFYEMLTGRKPYTGATAMEVLQQHVNSPLPPLPHSLTRYEPLLRRLVAKNRDERFGSADEIITAIAELRAAILQDRESAVA
ncbi:MAG TPA: protein kinase [Steroidobacteraceae bacterium]|nr:protein kinase [Steroidobacteraceae bacterium]